MRLSVFSTVVITAWLCIVLSDGALPPRGQPLKNANLMEQVIHHGLFPDKPREMSYLDYFKNLTGFQDSDFTEDFTKALERLEFGVLDFENLEIAVKLAEDAKRLKEAKAPPIVRRQAWTVSPPNEIFHYGKYPYAWTLERRNKLIQFMQHSVYSSRYEFSKLVNLRKKYQNSTVFQIGVVYGNSLELRTTAANLFTTFARMPANTVSMLWYVFHYHKLLNMAYDVASNTEYIYLLNDRLKEGFHHIAGMRGPYFGYSMPANSDEATSRDPENLYRRKRN